MIRINSVASNLTIIKLFRRMCAEIDSFFIWMNFRSLGITGYRDIKTFTSHNELKKLYQITRNCGKGSRFLEIGSYLGASSNYLGAAAARIDGTVYCVDTWNNETMPDGLHDTYEEFVQNTKCVSKWIIPIRKRSDQLEDNDMTLPIDFVFLDGDHTYEAVKLDFSLAEKWITENGIIAFHDSRDYSGVSRVIGEALVSGKWTLMGCIENLTWIRKAKFVA